MSALYRYCEQSRARGRNFITAGTHQKRGIYKVVHHAVSIYAACGIFSQNIFVVFNSL
jgi:hypothetical protein